ncbi:tyrosine-protein phosphatase [Streptomyces sp. NPDC057363]|uniref:tyrosine-protein phosphatase n=1 Tax=Streptomyces sp. NPDC057363 TaxID=3346107 RepID=UPI003625ED51
MRLPVRSVLPSAVLACALVLPAAAPSGATGRQAAPAIPAAAQRLAASPLTSAGVVRDGRSWKVSWSTVRRAPVTVRIRAADGRWRLIARHVTTGSVSVPARPGVTRPWFRLGTAGGAPVDVTTRSVGLTSAPNLRDVGGYRTVDGRWVRMGDVYRSQALDLDPGERAAAGSLGLTHIYDLRTPSEARAVPDAVPAGAAYTMINLLGVDGTGGSQLGNTVEEVQQAMMAGQRYFVTSPAFSRGLGRLLTSIAEGDGPQLFHCTAGKDRTGWATAVLLTLLGVQPDQVMADYLLSNDHYYRSSAVQAELAAMPPERADLYRHVLLAEPAYLRAGFEQVNATYGSMRAYAVEGLGVSPGTLAKLRHRLLVDRPAVQ